MAGRISGGSPLWRTLQEIVSLGPRWAGEEGERRAAGYIVDRFQRAGIPEVRYESFGIRTWRPTTWAVEFQWMGEWVALPSYPIWYSGTISSDWLEGEAVHLGYGFEGDFDRKEIKGKIALVRSRILMNHCPTHTLLGTYHKAHERGASGYLVLLDSPPGVLPRYNHLHEDEPRFSLPGLMVGGDDARFLDRAFTHGRGEVRLRLQAVEGVGETGDVVAQMPGRKDRWIVVGTHYDSVFGGAVDNAAANALMIQLAEGLAGKPLPKGILWVAHPAHEVDVGAREFVQRHPEFLEKVDCYLSLDGASAVGYHWGANGAVPCGYDEQRGLNCSNNPALIRMAIKAAMAHQLGPLTYVPADQMVFNRDLEGRFYERGVPFLILMGKSIWYHTEQDTAQRVDEEALGRSLLAHQEIINELLHTPSKAIWSVDRSLTPDTIAQLFTKKGSAGTVEVAWSWIPDHPHTGESVIFCVQSFFSQDTFILDILWEFGDGAQGKGPTCPHIYGKPGRYGVTLSVTDGSGEVHAFERVLWVQS